MSILVKSLKRLYSKSFITDSYLNNFLESDKITKEEYDYIKGE